MKTLVMLCMMVAAVTCQPVDDASSLTNFLKEDRTKYINMIMNNKSNIISEALTDLGTALGMAEGMITNNAITLEQGADLILEEFKFFMGAAPRVPSIAIFNQNVCASNQLPFPESLVTMFPDLTSELNSRVPALRESVRYNSAE